MVKGRGGINHTAGSLARGKARTAGRQRRPYPEATPKRRAPVALFPPKVLIEPKPQSKPPTPASQPNGIHSLENDDDNDHPVETTRVDKRERTERDWLLDSDLAFARRAGRAMSDTVEGTGGGGNMADIQKTAWWNDLNTSWRAGRIFEKKVQRRLNQRLNGAEGMKNGLGSVLFRKKSDRKTCERLAKLDLLGLPSWTSLPETSSKGTIPS